jgi:hypothetical protein
MIKTLHISQFIAMLMSIGIILVSNTSASAANEFWVAPRTDGLAGTGTITDPYDGSTQTKFDTVMSSLTSNSNIAIHLLPGSYQSHFTWNLPAGCKFRGSGKSLVTIQNADGYYSGANCIGTPRTGLLTDNVEVSDLTVDVNGTVGNAASTTTGGVVIYGNNAIIKNVRVINARGAATECFPIGIFAHSTSIVGALIENCEVDSFLGTNGTMIQLGIDSANTAATATGVVRGCYVHDCTAVQAFGSGGSLNVVFEGNYSYNCKNGFNLDSWTNTGLRVVNNQFMKCGQFGVTINNQGATFRDCLVQDNVVEIDSGRSSDFLAYWITDTYVPANHMDGFVVRNNIALSYAAGSLSNVHGFDIHVTSNLVAADNQSSGVLANAFAVDTGTPLLFDNTNTDATPMYANNGSATPRIPVSGNIVSGGPIPIARSSVPAPPASGVTLWVSASDGKLHLKDQTGSDSVVAVTPCVAPACN